MKLVLFALLFILLPVRSNVVFRSGEGGYSDFRIPALIAMDDHTLLAFSEGRHSHRDWGEIDVVAKLSVDGGSTWGPLVRVCARGTRCFNPTAVRIDESTALLWVGEYESTVEKPGPQQLLSLIKIEIDDGRIKVLDERDMTELALAAPLFDIVGPGAGIRTRAGALVVPARRRNLVSYDEGNTWYNEYLGIGHNTGETTIAETASGCLLRADRPMEPADPLDAFFRATLTRKCLDGSWEPYRYAEELTVPGHRCAACDEDASTCMCADTLYCQSSLVADNDAVYFVSPSSTRSRKNLAVWASEDDGETWSDKTIILPGSAGYSSSAIANGELKVLVESKHRVRRGCGEGEDKRWEISLLSMR